MNVEVKIYNADIAGAVFEDCDLRGTDFSFSDLTADNLKGETLI